MQKSEAKCNSVTKTSTDFALHLPSNYLSIVDHLINNYDPNEGILTDIIDKENLLIANKLNEIIKQYVENTSIKNMQAQALNVVEDLLKITKNYSYIAAAIINKIKEASRPEEEWNGPLHKLPEAFCAKSLQRIVFVMTTLHEMSTDFITTLIESIQNVLFKSQDKKQSLNLILNLTQLYLLAIGIIDPGYSGNYRLRIFIIMCLYCYNSKAAPFVYEVLCWCPRILKYSKDHNHDDSDILIIVIEHILMNFKYDMNNPLLFSQKLLSKLDSQYNFTKFKPTCNEVFESLIKNLNNGKVKYIPFALVAISKQIPSEKVKRNVLDFRLIPILKEYTRNIKNVDTFDEQIATLLNSISAIIKELPSTTDTSIYLSLFSHCMNGVDRPQIQESAVQAIQRVQQFNSKNRNSLT